MLKTFLNFKGVEILSRNEQKNIAGSGPILTYDCEKGEGAVMGPYLTPCINLPVEVIPFPGDPDTEVHF